MRHLIFAGMIFFTVPAFTTLNDYGSYKSEFDSASGVGITVPAANSFYSGICFESATPTEAYIGGLHLDSNSLQYAIVILQRPSDEYPLNYADQITSDQDEKLKWLVLNNAGWGRYFYELAEFKENGTVMYDNIYQFEYSIKKVGDELLVQFKTFEDDEEDEDGTGGVPLPQEKISAYCKLVKKY